MSDLTPTQQQSLDKWWQRHMDGDETSVSTLARRVKYTTFVSTSNGAGRSPRAPRTVELAGYNGRHFTLGPEPRGDLDRLLEGEILEGVSVPEDTTPYEHFVDELRRSA